MRNLVLFHSPFVTAAYVLVRRCLSLPGKRRSVRSFLASRLAQPRKHSFAIGKNPVWCYALLHPFLSSLIRNCCSINVNQRDGRGAPC